MKEYWYQIIGLMLAALLVLALLFMIMTTPIENAGNQAKNDDINTVLIGHNYAETDMVCNCTVTTTITYGG